MKYLVILILTLIPALCLAHPGHASYGTLLHEFEHLGGLLLVIAGLSFLVIRKILSEKKS